MGEIEPLAVPCPPMLVAALGYEGPLRHVAFWRSPAGDVLRFTDGEAPGEGSLSAWMAFVEHDSVWPHLIGYNFGSGEAQPTHWLLIDRDERILSVGSPQVVGRFVADSVPEEVRRRQAAHAMAVQDEHLARARRRMLRDAAFLDRLQVWLDDNKDPWAPS
jgi:hypothetical protein